MPTLVFWKRRLLTSLFLLVGIVMIQPALAADAEEEKIRALTEEFCQSIVEGDLSILDRLFDPSPDNIYYDINEGPMVGMERLRRIWRAATTNYNISRFEFTDDMRIDVGDGLAMQTGTWEQTQVRKDGQSRDFEGRATILWRKVGDSWKVFHYHASIPPPRERRGGANR